MKYNMIIPLAGKGQRMADAGYRFPKPLIWAGDRHILDYSMGSVDHKDCNLIFIVRQDHVHNWAIDKILKGKYGSDIQIVVSPGDTGGAADSCLLAKSLINNDLPLIVYCPDIYFEPKFVPTDEVFKNDGYILTFKANSTNYSYVQVGEDGYATRTAEKVAISEDASVGVYCFKSGKTFVALAEAGVHGKESYICPLYNLLIAGGGKVKIGPVPTLYVMGTPEELHFFERAIFPYFLPRGFILCGDHSGYAVKENAKAIIERLSFPLIDVGCHSIDDCDYADYIQLAVDTKKLYPGYLILGFCRSGQGVNICANKHDGVRGVLVRNGDQASLGLRHNAANFFAIPAGSVAAADVLGIITSLMTEKFEGGRHQNRLQKLGTL
jgi:RpiB/LacA/LacB family sugar-phosphate isomerase